jgi:hypothetical protein
MAIRGGVANTSTCETAFSNAFASAETAAATAGSACPVTGDAKRIERRVDAEEAGTAQLLAGEGRFHDDGDGTITDAKTGLMWEKKDQSGGLHDQGNIYTWTGTTAGTAADGTLFTTFLAGLNTGGGFAGHTDWRVPTASELETIIDYTTPFTPRVSAPFNSSCAASCTVTTCSCTGDAFGYWSSTSIAGFPGSAYFVSFARGNSSGFGKNGGAFGRGVRAGL